VLRQAAAENLRLARAVASASDGVLITDPPCRTTRSSTRILLPRITGYQPDEIIVQLPLPARSRTDSQTVAQIRSCIVEQREVKATELSQKWAAILERIENISSVLRRANYSTSLAFRRTSPSVNGRRRNAIASSSRSICCVLLVWMVISSA